jgi:hypothetical protein
MADTAPTNVTAAPPAAASGAPAANDPGLAPVRIGFAVLLALIAVALLSVAFVYWVYPQWFAPEMDEATPSWKTLFKHKTVWPIAILSLVGGLAAAGGVYVFLTGLKRPDRDSPAWLARAFAYCFFAGAAGLLLLSLNLFIVQGSFQAGLIPLNLWALFVAAVLVAAGLFMSFDEAPRPDKVRQMLMGTGLMLGGLTFFLGVSLGATTFWVDLGRGIEGWKERPRVLIIPVAACLVGLAIVFVSIQPAAPLLRTSQAVRRTAFAANLAVATLLLLLGLVVANVLTWTEDATPFFGRAFDWTEKGFHNLSDRTRNYVSGMREPVKVYVLLPRHHPTANDVTTMLDNCHSLNSTNFNYELIDTRSRATIPRRIELMKQYNLNQSEGLLLVSGAGEKGDYTFVSVDDLFSQDEQQRRGGSVTYRFKGEAALYQALQRLSGREMKIYFTTGHGELKLEGPMPKGFKMPRGGGDELSTLRRRLADRESVKVNSLQVDRTLTEIPTDANVVVVARPTQPFSAEEVELFRKYLRRERKTHTEKVKKGRVEVEKEVEDVTTGKIFLLFDAPPDKKQVATGFESLLTENGVKLGNDRILAMAGIDPTSFEAITDDESNNPVGRAFHPAPDRAILFRFSNARTVEAAAEKGGNAAVEPLMFPLMSQGVWLDTDFTVEPLDQKRFFSRQENRQKLIQALVRRQLSMAVAVSDQGPGGMPRDRAHAGLGGKETPRMVVFGSASWIKDSELSGEVEAERVALFTSCVNWLAGEEKDVGGEAKDTKIREVYKPNVTSENVWWLYHPFPGLAAYVLMIAVVILGVGIWVVRRR